MTDEQKQVLSFVHTGIPRSDACKLAQSKTMTGHVKTPAMLAKIAAQVGLPCAGLAAATIANTGSHRTLESREKIAASHRGSLCWNWKGGITPEVHRIRTSLEYALWRTAVYERDDYTCQTCGKRGGRLEAHHVHSFSEFPDERLLVENGVTLCLECHSKTKGENFRKYAAQEA